MLNELLIQEICLINTQNKLFIAFDFFNILFKVFRKEKIRISGVDNLQQEIRFLNNSPQLSPNFNVLLKWSYGKLNIIFFHTSDCSSPFKKR